MSAGQYVFDTSTGAFTQNPANVANTAAVQGLDSGYKIARGELALDGSNPTPVTTGLTTIVAAGAQLKKNSAPGVGTSSLTVDISSGTLNVYAWKVTASGDATLVASTGTETFEWWAIGT